VVSVRQVKAARALLAWSQGALAEASGVSEPTVARLEAQDGDLGGRVDTGAKILAALEAAGVIFLEDNGEGPGVRLHKPWGSTPASIPIEDLTAENDE
jgi:transcriptional regulator with XRE-family HTH domain